MVENEILKSLEEEKTKLESDFTIYTGQLKQLEENMASIEKEYKTKRENLEVNIERIRGAYRVVYDQLKKFGAITDEQQVEVTTEQPVTEKAEEVKEEVKKEVKENNKSVDKKSVKSKSTTKEKVVAGLTKEEIDKINKAVSKSVVTDENGNEIPEYLQ